MYRCIDPNPNPIIYTYTWHEDALVILPAQARTDALTYKETHQKGIKCITPVVKQLSQGWTLAGPPSLLAINGIEGLVHEDAEGCVEVSPQGELLCQGCIVGEEDEDCTEVEAEAC